MKNKVDDYIEKHDGVQKEWLTAFVGFMRENYPDITETISYQIPTYKLNRNYIAFSVAKTHFTLHTLDFELIQTLDQILPRASFGKGCAKVKYTDQETIPTLFDICRKIVARSAE